jgi:hypothetical protein
MGLEVDTGGFGFGSLQTKLALALAFMGCIGAGKLVSILLIGSFVEIKQIVHDGATIRWPKSAEAQFALLLLYQAAAALCTAITIATPILST